MTRSWMVAVGILLIFGCADVSQNNQIAGGCSESLEPVGENEYVSPSPSPSPSPSDTTAPTISSPPASGATDVSVSSDVTVPFSEAMDSSTINSTNITIVDSSGNVVNGSWTTSGTIATFNPLSDFGYSTTYAVTVFIGVQDSAGNSLESSFSWQFTTSSAQWLQQAYVKASNNDAQDLFSYTVSISRDTLVVGAWGEDSNQSSISNNSISSTDNSLAASGAVYVYERTGTNWTQQAYIKASNAGASDAFGYSVSTSGDTMAVGAIGEDSDSGAVYIYKRLSRVWSEQAYIMASNSDSNDQFGYSVSALELKGCLVYR